MELVASENDGPPGSVQDSGASATVTGVDYTAGTLESDSNWTAQMASLDADDYLFVEGDFGNKMSGFEAWVPSAAPGATAFFGVDRSVNTRLGGLRHTGTGKPIEEAIMDAAAEARRYGAKLDMGFMRLNRDTVRGSGDAARFGFDALMVPTPAGTIAVVSDPFAPPDVIRIIQSNTWKLYYSGSDLIRVIDDDDNKFMRETSNDGVEFRIKHRGQLTCAAPGHNTRVAI